MSEHPTATDRTPDELGVIVSIPGVLGGAPCLAGTRIPTSAVYVYHQAGHDAEAIIREYPRLTPADVAAAIAHEERAATEQQTEVPEYEPTEDELAARAAREWSGEVMTAVGLAAGLSYAQMDAVDCDEDELELVVEAVTRLHARVAALEAAARAVVARVLRPVGGDDPVEFCEVCDRHTQPAHAAVLFDPDDQTCPVGHLAHALASREATDGGD